MESSPALMAARQVLPNEKYYRFREYTENKYRARFLIPISQCIEQVSQAKDDNSSIAAILQSCQIKEHLHQAGNCCSGLMEMDTLMRDNIIVTDRGVYERKESLQTLCAVV